MKGLTFQAKLNFPLKAIRRCDKIVTESGMLRSSFCNDRPGDGRKEGKEEPQVGERK